MAMDFFEKVMNGSAFGSEFFKALDEATKNIQTNVHTVCEKWKNGELVSKDEEKYENGKKTLDVHQSKNIEIEGNPVKTDKNNGCVRSGSCGSDGGCNKCSCGKNESGVNPEDEINRLTLKVEELSNRNKELYELNEDIQKANDDLLYRNNSLIKENTSLKAKLDKFKNLLESEF